MDQFDDQNLDGAADSIAFLSAMRDDPAAPGTADEGGPVAHSRLELGYPFEDADVLADLFLNDGPTVARIGPGGVVQGSKPVAKPAPAAPVVEPKPLAKPAGIDIELLLVGHLPVLGSTWVLQYAKHVAQKTSRAVGLIRSSGGDATIDLVLPPSEVPPQTGPMPSVAEAVRFAATWASHWIVRLDENADATTPSDVASSIRLADGVTILTGADEAAVVGCYRVIKTLEPGAKTPKVHVAVMGSQGQRTDEAAAKLSRAAEKFLQSKVSSEACAAKISPGSSVNVYRGRPNLSHADLVTLIRRGQALVESPRVSVTPTASAAAASFPPAPIRAAAPIEVGDWNEEPAFAEPVAPEPPAIPALVPSAAKAEARPSPAKAQATTSTTGLARHLASLHGLTTRCPYAPDVELAIDPEGRLHLIASASEDPGATVVTLTTARAWATDHASLIGLAHPGLRQGSAVCHLLTAAPKSVRRLGDSDLKLHLLTAPAGTPPDGAGWVCVELN